MNKMIKKMAIAVPLVFSLSSGAANSTVYDLGTLNPGNNYSFSTPAAGPVFDLWNFTLGSLSDLEVDVFGFNNPSLTFALLDDSATQIGSSFSVAAASNNFSTPPFASLVAGTYHIVALNFTGTNTPGFYGFNLDVTPVPEPETYAMLLAGLGMVGFIARRRTSKA